MFINLVVGSRRNYRMSRKGNTESVTQSSVWDCRNWEERLGSLKHKLTTLDCIYVHLYSGDLTLLLLVVQGSC